MLPFYLFYVLGSHVRLYFKKGFPWIKVKLENHWSICPLSFKLLRTVSEIRINQFSRSVVSDSETPWIAARQASLSITNSWSPPKPISIGSVMSSSHLILCRPLLLLPPIPPSIRVFSSESTLPIMWPKYWSFIFSISPSNEYPGLISFRMGWFDLLAVQGTLKSLLQQLSVFKFLISDYMVLMILIILVWIFWFLMKLNIKSIWFSFPINFLLIILLIFW